MEPFVTHHPIQSFQKHFNMDAEGLQILIRGDYHLNSMLVASSEAEEQLSHMHLPLCTTSQGSNCP